jgi:hypothetical protein
VRWRRRLGSSRSPSVALRTGRGRPFGAFFRIGGSQQGRTRKNAGSSFGGCSAWNYECPRSLAPRAFVTVVAGGATSERHFHCAAANGRVTPLPPSLVRQATLVASNRREADQSSHHEQASPRFGHKGHRYADWRASAGDEVLVYAGTVEVCGANRVIDIVFPLDVRTVGTDLRRGQSDRRWREVRSHVRFRAPAARRRDDEEGVRW